MKTNTPVYNTIRKQHAVTAVPLLIAEFNWNRYAVPTANNNPAHDVIARDPDFYPIDSIVQGNRPKRGHVKAQLDGWVLVDDYAPTPPATRHHIAEAEDVYKYWSGPDPSAASAPYDLPANASGTLPTGTNPFVTYDRIVSANKIVIGLENSVVSPVNYEIFAKATVGGAWIKIADQSSAVPDSQGRINLWWNGTGWTQTKNLTSSLGIAGVQIRVTRLNQPNKYFQLIEIAACLEKDFTDYMTSVSDQFDLGDSNVLSPIGKITSNVADITLFNSLVDSNDESKGLIFNQNNTNSPFYGLMKENVKFTLQYIFDASAQSGSTTETIQQFVMFAEQDWGADSAEDVNINVRDSSKFLQEVKCPETFYITKGKMTVGEIVWRLLDNVGFLDYQIDLNSTSTPLTMNYFWVSPDKYVWDVLSELADATQTAIYVDGNGILRVKTKEAAFNAAATPVWTLRGQTSGTELEDIVADTLQNERKDISNSIKVNYRTVDFERSANDNIISQIAWTPEDETVILRSSDLSSSMAASATFFTIPAADATNWQYTGMVQIEGEVIEYDGKQYRYIDDTDGGATKYAKVTSLADYQKYYWKTNANNQYRNGMTGVMYIKERGMWNTNAVAHNLGTYNYEVKSTKGDNAWPGIYGYYYAKKKTPASKRTNKEDGFTDKASYVRLQSTSSWSTAQYLSAARGSTAGDAPNFYGTRLRIPGASQRHYRGGLVINATGNNVGGYHIEMRPTAYTTKNEKEISVYVKNAAGTKIKINGKGWRANIVKNKWYSLDVQLSRGNSSLDGGYGAANHYLWVWLDGRLLGRTTISGSNRKLNSDKFGMYLSGSSAMDFEYLYAYERKEVTDAQFWGDDVSFYDRVKNGYVANQSLDEFTEKTRRARRRIKKKNTYFTQRYDTKFFDEFGPVVHEMRKFDVNFEDKLPGLAPKLLATNMATAKYLDFRSTAFGAEFYAVNSSHGDTNIHGTFDEVDQSLMVVMQQLVQAEQDTVTVENENAIRVSGKKELEFTSDWIQSKDQATNIGEWVKAHWDDSTDEITLECFGNPLLELTDVVYVNDPESSRVMVKYFVISTITSFDQGLSTQLRLRKVRV